jgi:Spy/CpxP family protein refolding chaperone
MGRSEGMPMAGGMFLGMLTEEQRMSMRDVMQDQREKTRDLEEKLRKARQATMETALTGKFNESAVRKKALEQAKIEAELSVLRAKALASVKPPLTPEQIERLKNPPAPQFGNMRQGQGYGGPEGMRQPGFRGGDGLPPRPQPEGQPPPPPPR